MADSPTDDLLAWSARQLGLMPATLRLVPVAGDASFRRYYRVQGSRPSRLAVHAPPATERNPEFLHVAALLDAAGVRVPAVLAFDEARGFLLIEDFGDTLLLGGLSEGTVDAHYALALATLLRLQRAATTHAGWTLPDYSAAMLEQEMRLFPEWFLRGLLGIEPDAAESALLDALFARLVDNARAQPQLFVHRDYHSRNLMLLDDGTLGVIDFQGAVTGPLCYDAVSLLRDCYVRWAPARVDRWALDYFAAARHAGLAPPVEEGEFLRWFDWTGLQRHIKVLGIFARLSLRDGKPAYLRDLPLVMRYVLEVAARHPGTAAFADWLRGRVLPVAAQQDWYRP